MIAPYQFHDYCQIFPQCSDDELQMLVSDIRENGLQQPIVLYEGKILDGRNRYLACQLINQEPKYVEYDGKNPLTFVVSHNLVRRHLNESQRAMVAANIIAVHSKSATPVTLKEAAEQMNVSPRLVSYANSVVKDGTEQDVKDVMSGEKRIRSVAGEIKEANEFSLSPVDPKQEQIAILTKEILTAARSMRGKMTELFSVTKWSYDYKKLHRQLHEILFDE